MGMKGVASSSPENRLRDRFLAAVVTCAAALLSFFLVVALSGCSAENENTVVIYSCGEGELRYSSSLRFHGQLRRAIADRGNRKRGGYRIWP